VFGFLADFTVTTKSVGGRWLLPRSHPLEAAGKTFSEMYIRAAALAQGKLDPMPTSHPEAPFSISAVAD
tara:strand:- start:997 stop:1203 length:207 start_codon:yes stop_codon:yes gene_type:complete